MKRARDNGDLRGGYVGPPGPQQKYQYPRKNQQTPKIRDFATNTTPYNQPPAGCFGAFQSMFGLSRHTPYSRYSTGIMGDGLREPRSADKAIKSYLFKFDGDTGALLDSNKLAMGPVLNKGGEGQVYKATYDGVPVAVKEIHNQHYELSSVFKREFQALRLIQHRHIIRLYGVVARQSASTGRNRFLLVMERAFCSLRDVINLAKTDNSKMTMTRVFSIAKQISEACEFIHSRDLLHLDLKPENILLDKSWNVKICDLGLAALCTSTNKQTGRRQRTMSTNGIQGTPAYYAPERVADMRAQTLGGSKIVRGPLRVSTAADVYSFAFVLWEMLHKRKAHPKEWDPYKIVAEVKLRAFRPDISSAVPSDLAKLITDCWVSDPALRPSFRTVYERLQTIEQSIIKNSRPSGLARFSMLFRGSGVASPERAEAGVNQRRVPGHSRQRSMHLGKDNSRMPSASPAV